MEELPESLATVRQAENRGKRVASGPKVLVCLLELETLPLVTIVGSKGRNCA